MTETLRQTQIELRTNTELVAATHGAGLRSWLISVQTLMSGSAVQMASVASSLEIVVPSSHSDLLDVEYLGQVDASIAVYRLDELKPTCDKALHQVKIKLMPKFSSEVYNFYMLDDLLCGLVGKKYLLHPKYVISLILAYARQHKLLTDKFIICDSFLSTLFGGVQWVKIKSLWNQILKLISPVSPQPLLASVKLVSVSTSSLPEANTSSVNGPESDTDSRLDVSVDEKCELYPGDWPQPTKSCKLKRTESTPCILSSPSTQHKRAAAKSKRSLRRHKTL